jgi:hypothetical protein
MKRCTTCEVLKDEGEFYFLKKKSYLVPSCKACHRVRTKEWNALHRTPEVVAVWEEAKRLRKAQVKDAAFAAYGGYVCSCCGETGRDFLTLDHIGNDGAKWREAQFGSRLYAGARTYWRLMRLGYPAGFQVLCMNCNWGKRKTGVCPHRVTSNDYPLVGVGPSGPKRTALASSVTQDDEIVSTAVKAVAARIPLAGMD